MSISLSLFVVLALIFGLAYLMRRFTVTSSGNGQMKVVASMMAGAKERIMVLQVGDEQHLIGITPNNINHLSTLKAPLETQKPTSLPADGTFKDKLVEAMAARIKPEKKHD
ncbi:flagellar biosynthetic protein FliO [Alteromonas sediminis]|uniref:flagellar biosynthetic protein FliO n=1 Tax=Alteromonas sediminis TaxID=2259342 RepID=UPI001F0C770B|nr:flagellar biosynthetic protein FliO [Alteromonas sediminis]